MAFEHIDQFIDLFVVGATLLLVGSSQLLLPQAGFAKRAAASAVATGAVFAASVALLETSKFLGHAAAIVLPILVLYHLLGSVTLRRLATAAFQLAGQSAVRSTGLLLAGLAVVIGSAVSYDRSDEIEVDRGMHAMELLSYRPPTALDTSARATTDRNRPVPLKKATRPRDADAMERDEAEFLEASNRMGQFVHTQTADDTSNCHGWVFTGGRSWVGNDEVDRILADNGYEAVDDPRSDDLVVYRHDGSVTHTAVVRAVVPNESVLVEGKWGWMGLFIHPVDQSYYGTDFTYYRSARSGHLLRGLAVNVSVTTRQRFR